MEGMTIKQYNKWRFFQVLELYTTALKTGHHIVETSLAVHSALAGVPKSYQRYVTKAFSNAHK